MPELPEVEIVRRDLTQQVIGKTISAVTRLDWPSMIESPDAASFLTWLPGSTIVGVGRRAKWLLLSLQSRLTLAIHLRMTGNLFVRPADDVPDRHTHLVLALSSNEQLFFRDIRKFGRVRLLGTQDMAALDAQHGPEPLEPTFSASDLAARLHGRRTRIKAALLDQRIIAGIGNIYADESLWQAGIHPERSAESLKSEEISHLHQAIQAVLQASIDRGGSTLRDYRNGFGEVGQNQHYFAVYGRTGQACRRCGASIKRLILAQRGTHYCPNCQPLS